MVVSIIGVVYYRGVNLSGVFYKGCILKGFFIRNDYDRVFFLIKVVSYTDSLFKGFLL